MKSTLLAKSDINFSRDFDLLGIKLEGFFYIDKMVLFGSFIRCALWLKFDSFLHWLTRQHIGNQFISHYLDNLLFVDQMFHLLAKVLCKILSHFVNI